MNTLKDYTGNGEKCTVHRGFIKGWAQGKLTGREHELAQLFLTLGF